MSAPSLPGGLHGHPPLTPAAVILKYRWTVPLLAATFAVLAVLAWRNNGSALRTWDDPVQRWVEGARTDDGDVLFHVLSQLGGISVVLIGLTQGRRCGTQWSEESGNRQACSCRGSWEPGSSSRS